jgi:DNA-binding MarR family transcriptional regulator
MAYPGGMTEWLDDDEMTAWRGLVEVFADVRAALDAELVEQFDLSDGDYGVLVVLSETSDQGLRMCDLASRLHLTPGGLTRRLDGLVARGLVDREPSTDDRRVVLAVLTDAGRAMLAEAAPVHVDGVRRHLLDHLSRNQLREIGAAFAAVREGAAAQARKASAPTS